jgi:hypothetical protein
VTLLDLRGPPALVYRRFTGTGRVALGRDTLLGRLKARSIHFDSLPATQVEAAELLPYVEPGCG